MASAAPALVIPVVDDYRRQEYAQVEIDVTVFVSEILARVRDPSRTYRPPQVVSWQVDSMEFTVGFRQKCNSRKGGCGHTGNRIDFKSDDPKARGRYVCPTCESTEIISSGQSERVELPLEVVTHGIKATKVYPNILSREGKILPDKDQTKQQIPQLKIVSMSRGGVQQAVSPDKYISPIDGREFDTLEQLSIHLEEFETDRASGTTTTVSTYGDHPDLAPRPVGRPAAADTMARKKDELAERLKRKVAEMEVRTAEEAGPEDGQAE